ncbi:MAG: transporter substrate-binding domain-containing protein [Methanoculleaceae archaeon]
MAAVLLAAGSAGPEQTPVESVKGKVFKVGIDAEYPPYPYLDKDGNAVGFDVDSMKWIAEREGFGVTFHPTVWGGIIPPLQAGKIDIIHSGMTITKERAEKVNFAIPYWKVNQSVAIHKVQTTQWTTLSPVSLWSAVSAAPQVSSGWRRT